MFQEAGKRVLFKAHAVAASAALKRPREEFLEAQAATALPVIGGLASARVKNVRLREIVSIRSAHTDLVGNFNKETGAYSILSTAVVEGLNVLGVVTADRIVARLASRYLLTDSEPDIKTLGSHFENLRIGGELVDFYPDPDIQGEWGTFAAALPNCRDRSDGIVVGGDTISASIGSISSDKPSWLTAKPPQPPYEKQPSPPVGTEYRPRNRVDIPDFGSIFLGEIFIKRGERHLTMLRIQFGCAYEGQLACGDVEGDAHPFPP
jgi:hypothetical protein